MLFPVLAHFSRSTLPGWTQVWTGEVIEPHNVFGGIPRSIAMSWISGCDVEVRWISTKKTTFIVPPLAADLRRDE